MEETEPHPWTWWGYWCLVRPSSYPSKRLDLKRGSSLRSITSLKTQRPHFRIYKWKPLCWNNLRNSLNRKLDSPAMVFSLPEVKAWLQPPLLELASEMETPKNCWQLGSVRAGAVAAAPES